MDIKVFSGKEIKEIHNINPKVNILIITDCRNISYNEESNTFQNKLSDKLGIDIYPICIIPTLLVLRYLTKNYGDYDYWFIDKSLFEYFS